MTDFNQSASSKLARDVVALGKKYSKTAFPNPTRDGCPTRFNLRAMAYRDRHLTLENLPISHVVRCSNCFQDYAHFRRMAVLLRGIQITAASLFVAIAALVALRFPWKHSSSSTEQAMSRARGNDAESPANTKQDTPSHAPLPIQVDLASLSPTRGEGVHDKTRKVVRLPQKSVRATLILPLGMEAGEYTIRLGDSKGEVVVEKRALGRIRDGTTSVEADLDLSGVARGSFILMIHPPGLGWRTFPAVIE